MAEKNTLLFKQLQLFFDMPNLLCFLRPELNICVLYFLIEKMEIFKNSKTPHIR